VTARIINATGQSSYSSFPKRTFQTITIVDESSRHASSQVNCLVSGDQARGWTVPLIGGSEMGMPLWLCCIKAGSGDKLHWQLGE